MKIDLLLLLLVLGSRCHALANRKTSKAKKPVNRGKGFGFVPPTSETYIVDDSASTRSLLQFLDDEECEGLDRLEVGFSKEGLRGVFAKETIEAGEFICAIPFVSTLLIDEEFIEEENNNVLSADKLDKAIKFLQLQRSEKQRKFQHYYDVLPNENFDETPDFWPKELIQQLEVNSLVQEMLSRKEELTALASEYDEDENTLQLAAWLVRSRAFTTFKKDGDGVLQRTVMIPFLDFINHHCKDHKANAELVVVETKAYEESFFSLRASKRIAAKSEIRLIYGTGKETTCQTLGKYGFLPTSVDQRRIDESSLSLEDFQFTTTLQEDETGLHELEKIKDPKKADLRQKQILELRTYLKRLDLK